MTVGGQFLVEVTDAYVSGADVRAVVDSTVRTMLAAGDGAKALPAPKKVKATA